VVSGSPMCENVVEELKESCNLRRVGECGCGF